MSNKNMAVEAQSDDVSVVDVVNVSGGSSQVEAVDKNAANDSVTTPETTVTEQNYTEVTPEIPVNPDNTGAVEDRNRVTAVTTKNNDFQADSQHVAEQSLISEMIEKGCLSPEHDFDFSSLSDGEFSRFPDADSSVGNPGWCLPFYDGGKLIAASYGTWRDTGENHLWKFSGYGAITEDQKQEFERKFEAKKSELKKLTEAKNLAAAEQSLKLYGTAKELPKHPYSVRKGIALTPFVRSLKGMLMIPLVRTADVISTEANIRRNIATAQFIKGSGDKQLLPGGKKQGAFHIIDGDDTVVLVAEGYATAVTLHEATGYTAVMAVDCGNLKPVGHALRNSARFKKSALLFCADNDKYKDEDKNPGVDAATAAVESLSRPNVLKPRSAEIVVPTFRDETSKPTDFNDLAALEGLEEVKNQVMPVAQDLELGIPPCYSVGDDIYRIFENKEGQTEREYVSTYLKVIAQSRNISNQNWGRYIELKDDDGNFHRFALPAESIYEAKECYGFLSYYGLTGRPQQICDYINSVKPFRRARAATQIGWKDDYFVLPDRVIGDDAELVVFQSKERIRDVYRPVGTLEKWQENVSKLCVGNNLLTFAVSVAFAAPLIRKIVSNATYGFHFRGASSRGKTTSLQLAQSVWGSPSGKSTWRSTGNGMEAIAADHNDALLCLDELGELPPKEAGKVIYMLGNGEGKARATKTGRAQERQTWTLFYLSTGEISLKDTMAQAGEKVTGGQAVRFIDIPAEVPGGHGVFDTVQDFADGNEFAMEIKDKTGRYYGSAIQAFLEQFTENMDGFRTDAARYKKEFIEQLHISAADAQVKRVAEQFALVYVGGMLATDMGITGWPEGEVIRSVNNCFQRWIEERGGDHSQEDFELMEEVKNLLHNGLATRFFNGTDESAARHENPNLRNPVGYVENDVAYIFANKFDELFTNPKKVKELLEERNYLELNSNGTVKRSAKFKRAQSTKKTTVKLYGIKLSILQDGVIEEPAAEGGIESDDNLPDALADDGDGFTC
ncbi:DUF927 domain-containing protein [Bacterioplanoides sp.]|uniref:TOPRIM and DUF927 domain-containing protein n=1 Tax=Bacterioplanoides sp. TaxID=2066072 RepID=UPI003B58B9B8